MPTEIRLGHQHAYVATDDLVRRIKKDFFGSTIEGLHHAVLVDHCDRVDRGIDDGPVFCLVCLPLRFSQLALGDVAHDAGEIAAPVSPPLGDREIQREDRAIPPPAPDLTPDTDNLRLAGRAVIGDVPIVLAVIGLGHQHADVAPNDFVRRIKEDLLGGAVEGLNDAVLVDHRDRIDRGVDDGAVFGVVPLHCRAVSV